MRPGRLGAALALVLVATCGAAQEAMPVAHDAHGQWLKQAWGEAYLARFESAPYPDDSRTTGYTNRKGESFPVEGHYDDNTVVIAVPEGYRPVEGTDVIIHFHGHVNTALNCLTKFRLGEMLEASGRNAILVIPQGPKNAPDSGAGKLEKPGGLERFLAELSEFLVREKKAPAGGTVRHVILSGHSGGYRAVGLAMEVGGATDRVREAWLFDAAYAQWDELARPFASPESGRRLRSICTEHLAPENIEIMSRLCLSGAPVFVVCDDHLTTPGVSREKFERFKFHSNAAVPGDNELPGLLRTHPNLFMYTTLSHNDLIMAENYFAQFARESPNLTGR